MISAFLANCVQHIKTVLSYHQFPDSDSNDTSIKQMKEYKSKEDNKKTSDICPTISQHFGKKS